MRPTPRGWTSNFPLNVVRNSFGRCKNLALATTLNNPRFLVQGQLLGPDAAQWQLLLRQAHRNRERPLCLCQPAGVPMYVACHRRLWLKRMPGTGQLHHPSCPCHEHSIVAQVSANAPRDSDGGAVSASRAVQLTVDFAWTVRARARSCGTRTPRSEEPGPSKPRMSLHQLLMYLLVRAGFHRWSPPMQGRRSAAVVCKYVNAAARDLVVAGLPLAQRLVVVQPRGLSTAAADLPAGHHVSQLSPVSGSSIARVLVVEEVLRCEALESVCLLWLDHLAGAPLSLEPAIWQSVPADLRPMLLSAGLRASDGVRLLIAALVRHGPDARGTVDGVAVVPMSVNWVPVADLRALPLVEALVAQHRRFAVVLPTGQLRADNRPEIWLLDAGPRAMPLRLASPEQARPALHHCGNAAALHGRPCWTWNTSRPIPPLPACR